MEISNINIITDFKNYCYINDNKYNNFNVDMLFLEKTKDNIIKIFNKNFNNIIINNSLYDYYHLDDKIIYSKIKINYDELKNIMIKKDFSNNEFNIPKHLLLNKQQIIQLLIDEIKAINQNFSYKHYIVPNVDNPFLLNVKIFFNKKKIKTLDFTFEINNKYYPYFPPILSNIKQSLKIELINNLKKLNILKVSNWSSTISLEYLIINIFDKLNNIIDDYIINDNNNNNNNIINIIEELIIITNTDSKDIININIPNKIKNSSGTGYSNSSSLEWDINNYIKTIELEDQKICKCLENIIDNLTNDDNINIFINSNGFKYIKEQIIGLNLLELDKRKHVYYNIFKILDIVLKYLSKENIETINNNILELLDQTKSNDEYINIYNTCLRYNLLHKNNNNNTLSKVNYTNNNEYELIMKKLQFGLFKIDENNLFYNNKSEKLNANNIKRVSNEISCLKSSLPVSWDTSIWVRISKENINFISFIISGPKDTPYENGLFEFHCFLPKDYPNQVPKVLLKTTGNNKFRFNPNLYQCGKICLSLLNTWSGEQWNPQTSTLLQVMVSIQSLILIEEPYFNEPGYDKSYGTPFGIKASEEYNKNIYPNTIRYAMIDMIKNPPQGFEDIIINHFKLKQDEIYNTLNKWEQTSFIDELKNLISKL